MTPTPSPPFSHTSPAVGLAVLDVFKATLDFVASLTASLAWPVVIFVIVLIFRRQIERFVSALKDRMPNIERVKTPWGEAVWSAVAVEKVSEQVAEALNAPDVSKNPEPAGDAPTLAQQIADLDPSAGVVHAFAEVEREAASFLVAKNGWSRPPFANRVMNDPTVPVWLKFSLKELLELKSAAAHGVGDVSPESAKNYIATADAVSRQLRDMAKILRAAKQNGQQPEG